MEENKRKGKPLQVVSCLVYYCFNSDTTTCTEVLERQTSKTLLKRFRVLLHSQSVLFVSIKPILNSHKYYHSLSSGQLGPVYLHPGPVLHQSVADTL